MPRRRDVDIALAGLRLVDATTGSPVDLGTFGGTQVVVLMRHRH